MGFFSGVCEPRCCRRQTSNSRPRQRRRSAAMAAAACTGPTRTSRQLRALCDLQRHASECHRWMRERGQGGDGAGARVGPLRVGGVFLSHQRLGLRRWESPTSSAHHLPTLLLLAFMRRHRAPHLRSWRTHSLGGQELLDQQQEAEVHHSYANKSLAPTRESSLSLTLTHIDEPILVVKRENGMQGTRETNHTRS